MVLLNKYKQLLYTWDTNSIILNNDIFHIIDNQLLYVNNLDFDDGNLVSAI